MHKVSPSILSQVRDTDSISEVTTASSVHTCEQGAHTLAKQLDNKQQHFMC